MIKQGHEDYELFRRAITHRDAAAWAVIRAHYRPLLAAWAARCGAWAQCGEWADDIADQVLARAWVALTPAHFAAFPTLARLLSYLRICVTTAVIDSVRARATAERALQQLPAGMVETPEQIALAALDRATLWRMVLELAATPAEHIILVESFVYGLPPRAIQARHPQLFAGVTAVYSAKRNLFARLQSSCELTRLRDELISL
jgi:DNA-directed RNA polymerase specialized sigma24 family protein